MNLKLIGVYGAFEVLLLLSSAFFGRAWFYSSQVAFAGSLLVLAATFRAYKKRVENGVRDYDSAAEDDEGEWGENHEEFPDPDPRRENSEQNLDAKFNADGGVNLSERDQNAKDKFEGRNLNAQIRNEQINLNEEGERNLPRSGQTEPSSPEPKKLNLAQNLKKNTPNYLTAFVPFRLIAYAVLVVGFLSLNRHGNLDVVAFLIALAVMPAGALIYGAKSNEN